jgi:hypothetical protein
MAYGKIIPLIDLAAQRTRAGITNDLEIAVALLNLNLNDLRQRINQLRTDVDALMNIPPGGR